jgi:hypothetical protein
MKFRFWPAGASPASAIFGFHPQTKSKLGSAARFSGAGYHLGFVDTSKAWTEPSILCHSADSSCDNCFSQSYDLTKITKLKTVGPNFSELMRRLKKSTLTLARRIPDLRISILLESTSIPAGADSPVSGVFRKTAHSSARATLDATSSTKTTNSVHGFIQPAFGTVGISVIVMGNLNGNNDSKTKTTIGTNRIQKNV